MFWFSSFFPWQSSTNEQTVNDWKQTREEWPENQQDYAEGLNSLKGIEQWWVTGNHSHSHADPDFYYTKLRSTVSSVTQACFHVKKVCIDQHNT